MVRVFAPMLKSCNGSTIATKNHLIEEKIILYWGHLPADIVETTKPDICLFSN